jgi:hypothetical protein
MVGRHVRPTIQPGNTPASWDAVVASRAAGVMALW